MSHPSRSGAGSRSSAAPRRRAPARRRAPGRRPHDRGVAEQQVAPPLPGFDDFYMSTRRRLLLEALAISGNLSTSRHAVRQAYIAARHHWHKIGATRDPEAWVRQRACGTAGRLALRASRVEKTATPPQAAVLSALLKLTTPDRSVASLILLGRVPVPEVGQQLAIRAEVVSERLANATARLAELMGCAPSEVQERLESLAPLVKSPGLPRVSEVHRRGARRRRWHIVGGTIAAVGLTVAAGGFVSTHAPPASDAVRQARSHPVTNAMLLAPASLTSLGTGWSVATTRVNDSNPLSASTCQSRATADPHPLRAIQRILKSPQGRKVVQSVEVSPSVVAAQSAWATTLRWYAGCVQPGVRLSQAQRLTGVGDTSVVLDLTAGAKSRQVVAITRSGQVTNTILLSTRQPRDSARTVAAIATTALGDMCKAGAIGPCRTTSSRLVTYLPPSGETPGMLAAVDMPLLPRINHAWVGTNPVAGGPNLAATTCDRSVLSGKGHPATSRTFLIPKAALPTRFGLTEVTAKFANVKAAKRLLSTIRHRMSTCENRQLGSSVRQGFTHTTTNSSYAGWRLSNEINSNRSTVKYWMGVVRVGARVAQVGFAPAGKADIGQSIFAGILARAAQRLTETSGVTSAGS